jgi:hypothetical protein
MHNAAISTNEWSEPPEGMIVLPLLYGFLAKSFRAKAGAGSQCLSLLPAMSQIRIAPEEHHVSLTSALQTKV